MLHLRFSQRALRFNFPARTSRGSLAEHVAWYLHLSSTEAPEVVGLGEAAPLAGLSPDFGPAFPAAVASLCARFNAVGYSQLTLSDVPALVGSEWPALRFALETAVLDWTAGGQHQLYANAFSFGQAPLPINGLVWMGDAAFMREQISQKLAAGYSCLKLKIGGLDFATELNLLAEIRAVAGPERLVLRVDANGAFAPADAPDKLARLAQFALHSIEQPIAAGQGAQLRTLCQSSPVPIALDEELISITDPAGQAALLDSITPAYIVLKPTLLGGHAATRHWIALARERGIGWWMTSALESNVGLNAVAQLAGEYEVDDFAQGLGTGQLYLNNVAAPLHVAGGELRYEPSGAWDQPDNL